MNSIALTVVLILALIFIHELGHFLVGRFFGIAVDVFSIGFGPKIASFQWRGVDYRLCLIPLGGYVRFLGVHPEIEAVQDRENPATPLNGIPFCDATLTGRLCTIAAGPVANLLLAAVVYTSVAGVGLKYLPAFVGEVLVSSPAERAGLQYGDIIESIDGEPIESWNEVLEKISEGRGLKNLRLQIRRDAQVLEVDIMPDTAQGLDRFGNPASVGRVGISPSSLSSHIDVIPGSPAFAIGLRSGDLISALEPGDGKASENIVHWTQLKAILSKIATERKTFTLKTKNLMGAEVTVEVDYFSKAKVEKELKPLTVESFGLRSPDLMSKDGRKLVSINGVEIKDRFGYLTFLENHTIRETRVGFRDRESLTVAEVDVKVKAVDRQLPSGRVTVFVPEIEFLAESSLPDLKVKEFSGAVEILKYGVTHTAHQTGFLIRGLRELITGGVPLQALGGPIMIAKVAHDAASASMEVYFEFMALMSVNLAVINLFPIPATDGGQIVMNLIERLQRRRLSLKAIENFQKIGFTMIFFLIILATYNDLSRFWLGFIESVFSIER